MRLFKAASLKDFLSRQWLAMILIALGTFLRFYNLPEKGILFGDSGHDLLVAAHAVETQTLPMLGIPSSVPRFHQGPLTIWLSMGIYAVVGYAPNWYFWSFAFIGCLALIALYEFCLVWFNQKIGLYALTFLAFSPLAIAHSRMVYHTVPIAFFTIIFLWNVARLFQREKLAWPIAILAATLLFQHELSLFPAFFTVPIAWWLGGLRQNLTWRKAIRLSLGEIFWSGAAVCLGLLPQIISEVRDHSHQLSGFGLWLGYRVVSFLLPTSDHFGAHTFVLALERFVQYGSRVFLVPGFSWVAVLSLIGIIILSAVGWAKSLHSIAAWPAGQVAVGLVTSFITAGYLIHGAPSEAYFPVYVALLPLILAIGLTALKPTLSSISTFLMSLLALTAILGVWQNDFFVDQAKNWSYGPSLSTQQKVLDWIKAQQPNQNSVIGSHDAEARFESYFESYVWLAQSRAVRIQPTLNQAQADFWITHTHPAGTQFSFSKLSHSPQLPKQLSLPAVQVVSQ